MRLLRRSGTALLIVSQSFTRWRRERWRRRSVCPVNRQRYVYTASYLAVTSHCTWVCSDRLNHTPPDGREFLHLYKWTRNITLITLTTLAIKKVGGWIWGCFGKIKLTPLFLFCYEAVLAVVNKSATCYYMKSTMSVYNRSGRGYRGRKATTVTRPRSQLCHKLSGNFTWRHLSRNHTIRIIWSTIIGNIKCGPLAPTLYLARFPS